MIKDVLCSGKIKDISSVGMAFVFNEEQILVKNSMLKDVQLKLKGKIGRVSGPVVGSRVSSDGTIFVMIFDKTMTAETKDRIHSFIYETLQDEMTKLISAGVQTVT
jgi:hypothetical protein